MFPLRFKNYISFTTGILKSVFKVHLLYYENNITIKDRKTQFIFSII